VKKKGERRSFRIRGEGGGWPTVAEELHAYR
jgi:hypothetical protein